MLVKRIFSDMDGTLLNQEGSVNPRNVELIKQSGLPMTLVSARAPMEMVAAMDALNLTGTQIAFNGGLIFKKHSDYTKIIDEHYLEESVAHEILEGIKKDFPNVSQSFYDLDNWYSEKIDFGTEHETSITHIEPTIMSHDDYFNQTKPKIFKIMLVSFDDVEMTRLLQYLDQLNNDKISIQSAGANYVEITDKQAKKSHGISYIMEQEKLTKEETAAFGDGHNDLPMLNMVGYPIVMENALPEIKKVAKFITKSNVADGVGYGILHYLK